MSAKLYTLNLSIKFFKNFYEFKYLVFLIYNTIFVKQKNNDTANKVIKRIKVCLTNDCNNTPTEEIEVGNEFHIYCCEKGFLQAMEEFSNPVEGPHTITDESICPKENTTNDMIHLLNGLLVIFRL